MWKVLSKREGEKPRKRIASQKRKWGGSAKTHNNDLSKKTMRKEREQGVSEPDLATKKGSGPQGKRFLKGKKKKRGKTLSNVKDSPP